MKASTLGTVSLLALLASLAASSARAQVGGTVLVGGTTPVVGTCPSGDVLYNNAGLLGCEAVGGGSGTVTSVGATFTGGLISISGSPITTAGTFGFTVAGTSGGVPYFSSASAWGSSALLAANALLIGGGAGNPPASTTTGTGVLTALGVAVNADGGVALVNGTPVSGNCLQWSATGAQDAGAACGGGGGGTAIEPETGSSIKISAFPAAATPMGSGDGVTGLQGGANVNFSQEQIFTGQDGAALNDPGAPVYLYGGKGSGTGAGGVIGFIAGASTGGANGAGLLMYGGTATDGGGFLGQGGGAHFGTGQAGGGFTLTGGYGYLGNGGGFTLEAGESSYATGGSVLIKGGNGNNVGSAGGSITLQAGTSGTTNGNILFLGLPISAVGLPSGAVWSNAGILTLAP